ncbi:MAG TPA: protein kinase, partial [Polyangiales bacterium]|nr:protein kinase [Polyangiales bacterium]
PEQMRSGRLADERSDIWSLGVILYELLSGHVPFSADNLADLAVKIATETVTPLSEARPEVPVELSQVIARCLDKERSQRFANIGELARALAPFGPSRGLAHAERAERILQATHASTPRARITPMTISTAITALGSHSRLRGVGPARSVVTFAKVPKRALWIGAALVGASAIGGLLWGLSTRDAAVVSPRAEETRTQAARADEQVPSIATAEALDRPAQGAAVDSLPTGAGAPVKQAALPAEPVPPTAAKDVATPLPKPAAASAKNEVAAPAIAQTAASADVSTPKAKAAPAAPATKSQSATPAADKTYDSAPKSKTKAAAATKPRPPIAADHTPIETKPVAPPSAAPKTKDSELDSLGGRL